MARGNARLQLRILKSEQKMYEEKAEEMRKKANDLVEKIEEQERIEDMQNKIVIKKTRDIQTFEDCKKAVEECLQ